jgi:uncharacterized protein (TIGR03067 family)
LAVSMIGLAASLFAYRTLAGDESSAAAAQPVKLKAQQNQPTQPAKPKTDKDKLQGTWIVDSDVADSLMSLKLVFVRDKVTFHFTEEGNALIKEGTYTLDSKKDPKEIDFTCDNRTQEAIYTFEKDRLKVALAEHGQDRPTKFAAPAGTRQALIVFKRDKEDLQKRDPEQKRLLEQTQKHFEDADIEAPQKLVDKESLRRNGFHGYGVLLEVLESGHVRRSKNGP